MSSVTKITLHHLNASRSDRIFWLLEELQVPYNVRVYFRLPSRFAPPELKKVSPFGKAPVLQLDGETLTESGYIVHRLFQEFGKKASGSLDTESNDSVFWSHFSEGSLMIAFQAWAVTNMSAAAFISGQAGGLDESERAGVAKYRSFLVDDYLGKQCKTLLDQVEKYLAEHPGKYFSGTDKPGQGDFMMFFPINSLFAGSRTDAGFNPGPATKKWWEMVMARPAAKKAMERLQAEEEGAKSKI
ncbi:putative glutathione transferase [Naematelia encephala]|uniref:Putative glutathione transferase n=1 Tax=Naematelia encephala TaxID=71784 RepID=A0A1Y2AZK9_9TREE|nr:putative glutathione transferase [Naematelia encephala]